MVRFICDDDIGDDDSGIGDDDDAAKDLADETDFFIAEASLMQDIGRRAKAAAAELAFAPSEVKRQALEAAADALWRDRATVIAANAEDVKLAHEKDLTPAMIDRLTLDEARIWARRGGACAGCGPSKPAGIAKDALRSFIDSDVPRL